METNSTRTLGFEDETVKSWKSNDTNVVVVKDGVVTSKTKGTATVTAILANGYIYTWTITVKNNYDPIIPMSSSIKYETETLKYYVQNSGSYYLSYIWMDDPYMQIKKIDSPQHHMVKFYLT